MKFRFASMQIKAASAAAALAFSTLFVGTAVGPALVGTGTVAQAQAPVA